MKQILQNLKNGATELAEVPLPQVSRRQLLIHTRHSLVSAGTERMLVEFGKANILGKVRQQPDKVRMVLEKMQTDGVGATLEAVQSKLDQPLALGYCNVGAVVEAGKDVSGFSKGDRVVSNGAHAEYVAVPGNLCARVPDTVSGEQAAFTVLAAIGLQGIRLVNPTLGECVAVTGLGLIGLLTVQMLHAQGCRVLGIDLDPVRLKLARQFGAEVVNPAAGEDVLDAAQRFSRGRGVDAVIITASTKSSEPVHQAAQMCRQRGRIVLVGVTGLELSRADFYEKELSFQVSCSYGPGRYDPTYEEDGQDYPIGFVRWTEQRNFEAVLDLMAAGFLDVGPLISHRFPLEEAVEAYDLLGSGERSLGILLEYPLDVTDAPVRRVSLRAEGVTSSSSVAPTSASVGFLGAGNYAGRVLIPAFREAGAQLHTVVSSGGVTAMHYGRKNGFREACTDSSAMLAESAIDTVVIATRHNAHARQVLDALRASKHVFCEKPLCLTLDELDEIETEARLRTTQQLMVGFNRRFSSLVQSMVGLLEPIQAPKHFIMTVNAGDIPPDHWTQDSAVGGGRLIGEGCHFIDLLRHLAASPIRDFTVTSLGRHPAMAVTNDKITVTLRFEDGSVGNVHYLANGHKGFPKERLEVFCVGRVLQLDNFRVLRGWGWPGFSRQRLWRQDKGQKACAAAFIAGIREGTPAPIPLEEVLEVSRVTIEAANMLAQQC
jgi:predicted dehydrogenase